jgi:hypothetical protein
MPTPQGPATSRPRKKDQSPDIQSLYTQEDGNHTQAGSKPNMRIASSGARFVAGVRRMGAKRQTGVCSCAPVVGGPGRLVPDQVDEKLPKCALVPKLILTDGGHSP